MMPNAPGSNGPGDSGYTDPSDFPQSSTSNAPASSSGGVKSSDQEGKTPAPDDVATDSASAANDAYDGAAASGPMHEQDLRNAGMTIDVPFESPNPAMLKYADKGQQTWTPPPGFRMGMPPIDPGLAENLGVPRDLNTLAPDYEAPGDDGADEGAEDGPLPPPDDEGDPDGEMDVADDDGPIGPTGL